MRLQASVLYAVEKGGFAMSKIKFVIRLLFAPQTFLPKRAQVALALFGAYNLGKGMARS